MARKPRLLVAGGAYHVTIRGVARLPIYRRDTDRRQFLAGLGEVIRSHEWTCHAYCLMTTHYHLLVRTPLPNLADGMQRLNSRYAQGFNRTYGGRGHVFESRYYSVLVQRDGHLLELCRYIALNPVRAGLCRTPSAWPWSSYSAVVGQAPRPAFLSIEWLLAHFGSDRQRARARLKAFVEDAPDVTLPSRGLTPEGRRERARGG